MATSGVEVDAYTRTRVILMNGITARTSPGP
jgi:hypothetical protein